MTTFLLVLTFLTLFLLVFGINLLVADALRVRRLKVRARLESEDRLQHLQRTRRFAIRQSLHKSAAETAEESPRLTLRERFVRLIEESGMLLRPAHVVWICGAVALCAGGAAGLVFRSWIVALCAAAPASVLPVLYVCGVRKRRQTKLLSQLADAFNVMSRSMRAGQTITQAMQTVASDFSAPVADEFDYCCEQQTLGLSPDAAMHALARRTGLLEMKIFVLAVMVHRQTGGNLSQLLDKLSTVIRQRDRIRGSIESLTAEGRMQMLVLLALPPVIFIVLMAINRPYALTLFEYPYVLVGTVALMLAGALLMRRIVNFDF